MEKIYRVVIRSRLVREPEELEIGSEWEVNDGERISTSVWSGKGNEDSIPVEFWKG